MIGLAAPQCMQCKAADAVAYAFFAELENAARALPWCESCMDEILPVLLHWGFAVNLQPADRPAALQVCEYGQDCPRLCKAGFRACPEHLIELREVYAGKESGASVDPVSDEPDWRAIVTEARQAADDQANQEQADAARAEYFADQDQEAGR